MQRILINATATWAIEMNGAAFTVTQTRDGVETQPPATWQFDTEWACNEAAHARIAEKTAAGFKDDFNEEKFIQNILNDIEMSDLIPTAKNSAAEAVRKLPVTILSPQGRERVLAQGLGLGCRYTDADLIAFCMQHIPAQVTWHVLAYNLACVCAMEKNKPALLAYARRCIELGKTKEQFLNDIDFDACLDDPEFLFAIGAISAEEMQQRLSAAEAGTPVEILSVDRIVAACFDEKTRNLNAKIEAAYAAAPEKITAALAHPQARSRLLFSAWIAGREDNPSARQVNSVLDNVAQIFAQLFRTGEALHESLHALGLYENIPGISHLTAKLKSLPVDFESNDKRENSEIYNDKTILECAIAFAGRRIPALYRSCSIVYVPFMYGDSRREDLHKIFMRCCDVNPSLVKFKQAYPEIGREEDFIDAIDEYDMEKEEKTLVPMLRENTSALIDTVKELAVMEKEKSPDKRFYLAWRMWQNGIGLELVPFLTEEMRICIHMTLGDIDYWPPKEKNPELDRLVAWIFGDIDEPLETVIPETPDDDLGIAKEACYFWDVADFPVRLIQYAFAVKSYDGLMFTSEKLDAQEMNERLLAHGMEKKSLLKSYVLFQKSHNFEWLFAGWRHLLNDQPNAIALYKETGEDTRALLLQAQYMYSEEERPPLDLMVHALTQPDAETPQAQLLTILGMSPEIDARLAAHPQAQDVKNALLALTKNKVMDISKTAQETVARFYGIIVRDPFVAECTKHGLPVSAPLLSLLMNLTADGQPEAPYKESLDKLFAENPACFTSIFRHENPCYRLLIAACLYDREPSAETMDKVADNAAEVFMRIAPAFPFDETVARFERFAEVPGMSAFVKKIKHIASEKPEALYSCHVIANAYALADGKIPLLYRILCTYCGAEEAEWSFHRAQICMQAIARCRGDLAEEAFIERYPTPDSEYQIMQYTYYNIEYCKDKLDEAIRAHPQAAIDVLREGPLGQKRFNIAWRAWEAGIGLEWMDLFAERSKQVIQSALYKNMTDSEAERFGILHTAKHSDISVSREEADRFLAWLYSENEPDIDDAVLSEKIKFEYALNLFIPFRKHKSFPARMFRYMVYTDDSSALDDIKEFIPEDELKKYLAANGQTFKEKLREAIYFNNNKKEIFAMLMQSPRETLAAYQKLSEYHRSKIFSTFQHAGTREEVNLFIEIYLDPKNEKNAGEILLGIENIKDLIDRHPRKQEIIKALEKEAQSAYSSCAEAAQKLLAKLK